ncbi:hypothetical protein [Leyella stercorea]|uniref:hypothetical protein n=1 Tax=Leyella stercorea TaxID=363265 RepID=UPI00242B2680|nr:hypothetical protein [Leyella stercorea]
MNNKKCNIELANLVEKLWRFAKYRLSLQLDNANVLNRIENDMQTLALAERYDVISRKNINVLDI